ncbi:MAG TPA: sigma factor-like helix-turn-helix DNA-binding protein [Blastocatellia bacterium]|nr:sigma factor-like helix-turn-helix DNA-binding protein [Blastocatellia bacterium]
MQRHPPTPAVVDAHVKQGIEKTIRRLKPKEREFLRLYYYEELSKEQIATRLGIKVERLRLSNRARFAIFVMCIGD